MKIEIMNIIFTGKEDWYVDLCCMNTDVWFILRIWHDENADLIIVHFDYDHFNKGIMGTQNKLKHHKTNKLTFSRVCSVSFLA